MKKSAIVAALIVMAFSLAACATPGGERQVKVKCPACGYEFEVPHISK